jgi:hypothetical protein
MKPSIIALLASFFLLQQVRATDPIRVFTPNSHGVVAMDGAPSHVVDLIKQIKGTDMEHWVLSEEKGSKWLVSKVTIIEPDLILVRLSDGNGIEDLLFDRDYEKHWTIIRRAPVGDWKPKDQRRGDRLSALRFPEQEAQQDGGGQPATRPELK